MKQVVKTLQQRLIVYEENKRYFIGFLLGNPDYKQEITKQEYNILCSHFLPF